ncbi:SPOR domain-containing protein [Vibrio sp. TRT 17S01]|uniref:SPOR domain-containing protein n=1 Tax=Vibrio sp. TRT 17S01 TaxID=3418505 RepID=UPI003CFA4224
MKTMSRKMAASAIAATLLLAGCATSESPCSTNYLLPSQISDDNFQCQEAYSSSETSTDSEYNYDYDAGLNNQDPADSALVTNTIPEDVEISEENSVSSEEAYADLNPTHYTVQVLALQKEKDLRSQLSFLPGADPVWVNWTRSNGQSWYVVIYGDYSSYEQAKQAINRLPNQVQAQGPFVRSFSDVQRAQETNVVRLR